MRILARRLFFVFLLGLLASLSLWGQAAASLTGTVTDPTGAVIPGAKVKLTNPATGVVREATTASDGSYVFTQLAPAAYTLEVTAQGFATLRQDVRVAVATAQTADVTLEVGTVAEVVEVEAEAAVQKVDASMGTPFSGSEVRNLPMLDRDPAGLLSLQAAVAYVPANTIASGQTTGDPDDDGRSGAVAGARSDQTNITLDGVDVNDAQYGYAFSSVLRTTLDSLQEFRVTTNNYNADLGRSSAAQVSLVTTGGGNNVHGAAYWVHRNEALGANAFFLNQSGEDKPKLRRHVYGASLGGPVVKDRFFLFGNFEQLRESKSETVLRDIPSLSFRDGVLIYECDDPADPACDGTSSAVGLISGQTWTAPAGFYALSPAEAAAIDPLNQAGEGVNMAALAYFNLFPAPNSSGNFDDINISGFRFASPVKNLFSTMILRADLNLDTQGKHIVFWRGNYQDDSFNNPPQFPGQDPRQSLLSSNKGFGAGYTAIITPSLVNNFRVGLTRIQEGFAGLQADSFVDFRFIDEQQAFMTDSLGRRFPLWQFRDDVSWTKGTHTITFGADLRFLRNRTYSNESSFHDFVMNPSWLNGVGRVLVPGNFRCAQPGCTAVPAVSSGFQSAYRDSIVNLLGIITQANGQFNLNADGTPIPLGEFIRRKWAVDEYEFYVQDQWRATPTLTFTYGVRYYTASPPREQDGLQVNPVFDSGNLNGLGDWFDLRGTNMLQGIPSNAAPDVGFDLSGPANGRPNFFDWDKNNFSPRVALAWAPRSLGWLSGEGKLVVRAGYGLVYDRFGPALITTYDRFGSFGLVSELTSTFAGCGEGPPQNRPLGVCPRFTGTFDTAAAIAAIVPDPPCSGFPCFFPGIDFAAGTEDLGSFAITSALDAGLKTPYSHAYNFSIARELPWDLTVEASYVGRYGHGLLVQRDAAMPADLCDPASGRCYFDVAREMLTMISNGVDITQITDSDFGGYWANLFPAAGPLGINEGFLDCDAFGVDPDFDIGGFSSTQVFYDYFACEHPDTTVIPFLVDLFPFPAFMTCASGPDIDGDGFNDCPFAFFDDQFAALSLSSSIGQSGYNAFVLSMRKRLSSGLQFNFNYTLSKSLDHTSTPERQGDYGGISGGAGGYTGFLINSWDPDSWYSFSDFDIRHQINMNWYYELPFGRGRPLASDVSGWANQIIGGWSFSGLWRWNTGLPANVLNDRVWPTNWNVQGNATCVNDGDDLFGTAVGPCPATQNVHNSTNGRPNLFSDPETAIDRFRFSVPGEPGGRNLIRGDGYFTIDIGVSKDFSMPWEGHKLGFTWQVFNLTNSVYFDPWSAQLDIGSSTTFGNYTETIGQSRLMQFGFRYEF